MENVVTVYKYTDVQSGDVSYSFDAEKYAEERIYGYVHAEAFEVQDFEFV